MNLMNKITMGISKVTGRTGLLIQKRSPEILIAVGVTSIVGCVIMSCRATLKLEETLDRHNEKVEKYKEAKVAAEENNIRIEEYSDKEYRRDIAVVYMQTTWDLVKLYGPPITLGVAGIVCILSSHGIMKQRNAGLLAAYKLAEGSYNALFDRVREEVGEEKANMWRRGEREVAYEETVTDENGKNKKVKKTEIVQDPNLPNKFARFFDKNSREWGSDWSYNEMFVVIQQNQLNDLLQSRGHVTLNDFYDAFGIERTPEGCVLGWLRGKGDDYICCGFEYNDQNQPIIRKPHRNCDDYDQHILLLPNINEHSVIWDQI